MRRVRQSAGGLVVQVIKVAHSGLNAWFDKVLTKHGKHEAVTAWLRLWLGLLQPIRARGTLTTSRSGVQLRRTWVSRHVFLTFFSLDFRLAVSALAVDIPLGVLQF